MLFGARWALVAVWLLFVACGAGGQQQEPSVACYDGPFENTMMDGCVDECTAFETLPEAESHCNSLEDCNGIVKTTYGDEGAIRLGVGLYEVRRGPAIRELQGDTMWVKQEVCGHSIMDEIPAEEGGGQLYRQGDDARIRERPSYGDPDNWDDDWDDGLDESVAMTYRDVFMNIMVMVTFLGMLWAGVAISYKMRHEMTVELVDRFTTALHGMLTSARTAATPDMASRGTYDTL